MSEHVVLRASNPEVERWALGAGCILQTRRDWEIRAEKTLFVSPGVRMARDLLKQGFRLLDRWDIAVPLWRYGVLAQDIGSTYERKRTKKVILDLRVLLYAHELLFVRSEGNGGRFLQVWREQCEEGGEERLAFLRALHIVKPIICTLPQGWAASFGDGVALTSTPVRRAKSRVPARPAWAREERVSRREGDPAIREPVRRR